MIIRSIVSTSIAISYILVVFIIDALFLLRTLAFWSLGADGQCWFSEWHAEVKQDWTPFISGWANLQWRQGGAYLLLYYQPCADVRQHMNLTSGLDQCDHEVTKEAEQMVWSYCNLDGVVSTWILDSFFHTKSKNVLQVMEWY
jgi:hypothetical protein